MRIKIAFSVFVLLITQLFLSAEPYLSEYHVGNETFIFEGEINERQEPAVRYFEIQYINLRNDPSYKERMKAELENRGITVTHVSYPSGSITAPYTPLKKYGYADTAPPRYEKASPKAYYYSEHPNGDRILVFQGDIDPKDEQTVWHLQNMYLSAPEHQVRKQYKEELEKLGVTIQSLSPKKAIRPQNYHSLYRY